MPKNYQQYDHSTSVKRMKRGRPQDLTQAEAFMNVIKYLDDNDEEQLTVNDLIGKKAEYLDGTGYPPYGFTHIKGQLQKELEAKIIITELNGKPNVVTMWRTAMSILQEFHSQPKVRDIDEEKERIIQTAAKLLKTDIKLVQQDSKVYPTHDEMA